MALIPQGLGLGLDLVTCVLGLGLGSQVLVNITAVYFLYLCTLFVTPNEMPGEASGGT